MANSRLVVVGRRALVLSFRVETSMRRIIMLGFVLMTNSTCWFRSCPSNAKCGEEVLITIDSAEFEDECPFDGLVAHDTADTGDASCAVFCEALADCLGDVRVERQVSCELTDERVLCTVAELGECLDQC